MLTLSIEEVYAVACAIKSAWEAGGVKNEKQGYHLNRASDALAQEFERLREAAQSPPVQPTNGEGNQAHPAPDVQPESPESVETPQDAELVTT